MSFDSYKRVCVCVCVCADVRAFNLCVYVYGKYVCACCVHVCMFLYGGQCLLTLCSSDRRLVAFVTTNKSNVK